MEVEKVKHESSHVGHVAFVILVFLIGGVIGYAVGQDWQSAKNIEDNTAVSTSTKTKSTASTATTSATSASASATTTTDPTAGWKTYTNSADKYSIKYPSVWDYALINNKYYFATSASEYDDSHKSTTGIYTIVNKGGATGVEGMIDQEALQTFTAHGLAWTTHFLKLNASATQVEIISWAADPDSSVVVYYVTSFGPLSSYTTNKQTHLEMVKSLTKTD